MQELLKDIRSGKAGKIITYKLDRLTRNVVDTYNLIKELDLHQCELAAIIDNLDTTSANGRLFVDILSIIVQWEREVISERTIDGMVAMAQLRKHPFGSTPFGWRKDECGRLHIDPTDSEIVLYAADRILEGHSLAYISTLIKREFSIHKSSLTQSRSKENIISEIYANMTVYNLCSRIRNALEVRKRRKKHIRKLNFGYVISLIREYLFVIRLPGQLKSWIKSRTEPERAGRADIRKKNRNQSEV